MFYVNSSPSQLPLAGSVPQAMPAMMPMMGDGGVPTADMSSPTTTNAAAAPPSYEAIVLDPNGPRSQTNLFVRKLASAVKEDDLKAMFERYGTIVSFALMRDIHTGESLGTAFVRYRTHDEARAAMAGLDGTELYGRPISIQWAKKEHDGTPCGDARRKIHKLFVRNIPLSVTARQLRQVFAEFGSINNVTLHSDTAPAMQKYVTAETQAEQMRNIAFILFQEDGAAGRAVSALHNTCPFPSCDGIPLMVKLAEDNRDRLGRKQKSDHNFGPVLPGSLLSSAPVSAAISPAQLSLDAGAAAAAMMQANMAQGMPFAMGPAAAAGGAPMLQATTDMNGNTSYVYVTAPMGTPTARMLSSPAVQGQYLMQTPAGLQAFPAAAMPTFFPPPQQQPSQQSQSSPQPPPPQVFPSPITMAPPMFVDAQGNPVTTLPTNMMMPNCFPTFSPQQMLLQQQFMMAQQQQQQQQQLYSQAPTPTQKRNSLPSFAEAASAAGYPSLTPSSLSATPTNAPFLRASPTTIPQYGMDRSPSAAQLPPHYVATGGANSNGHGSPAAAAAIAAAGGSAGGGGHHTHHDALSAHSVSPQLSSAASNTNLLATAASSIVATPMEPGMAVPAVTATGGNGATAAHHHSAAAAAPGQPGFHPPRTLVPVGLAAIGSSLDKDNNTSGGDDVGHPLFRYETLRMNDNSASLTATSSMTVANDLSVNAMAVGIEEDELTDSDRDDEALQAIVRNAGLVL